jgi:hypothetical protein
MHGMEWIWIWNRLLLLLWRMKEYKPGYLHLLACCGWVFIFFVFEDNTPPLYAKSVVERKGGWYDTRACGLLASSVVDAMLPLRYMNLAWCSWVLDR